MPRVKLPSSGPSFWTGRWWPVRRTGPTRYSSALLGFFFGSGGTQDVAHPVVAFVAGVLKRLLALVSLGEVHRKRPRLRPGVRIVEGHRPLHRVGSQDREALGHLELVARSAVRRLVGEVRRLDHERVAFPMPSPVTDVLADAPGHVRTPIERDDARVVHHLVGDRHETGALMNAIGIAVDRR